MTAEHAPARGTSAATAPTGDQVAGTPGSGLLSVLLVHGAWHTGGIWSLLVDELRRHDIRSAVAELHREDLAADIDAARTAMDDLPPDRPVIAVGHSYGGTVITGLPTGRLAHLVFLAATMPDAEETTLGLMGSAAETDLMRAVRPVSASGTVTVVDPTAAGTAFYHQLSRQQRERHVRALVPQEMSRGHQTVSTVAWRALRSTYVVCSEDRALNPELQERLARRATRRVVWPSDHSPFHSHPERLARLVVDLATTPAVVVRGAVDS